jgi:hypothetical protein
MQAILFLDMDGVVNEFRCDGSFDSTDPSCWVKPACVRQLDRIIDETGCAVVISSTWRLYVHLGHMTPRGFAVMMMTHGMRNHPKIIGVTPRDGKLEDRGQECRSWLRNRRPEGGCRFVAIDDLDLGFAEWGIPLVQTDGRVGLTSQDADRAIAILKGEL